MSVSFPIKLFLLRKFTQLSPRNIQVFRISCAKFRYPAEKIRRAGTYRWDLTGRLNGSTDIFWPLPLSSF